MPNPSGHLWLMRSALREAERALERGDYPVGAALVCNGRVVAHCGHCAATRADATRHAVLEVLREAAPVLVRHRGSCDLYTTLEPCMMCVAAAYPGGREPVLAGPLPGPPPAAAGGGAAPGRRAALSPWPRKRSSSAAAATP